MSPTGKEVRTIEVRESVTLDRLALSADGKKLLTLGLRGQVGKWDLADGRFLGSINTDASGMLLSPDGDVLATAGNPPQEEIRLWHVPTGTQLQRMPSGHLFAPSPTAFSPDGNCLAASGEHVHYYEVPTGKERCQFRGQGGRLSRRTADCLPAARTTMASRFMPSPREKRLPALPGTAAG